MTTYNQIIGKNGEQQATNYYLAEGYEIVAQNWNYYLGDKIGEIDLIVKKDNILVFVEVKTRTNDKFGDPALQITKKKLTCIYKSYQGFIKKHPEFRKLFVRMDLVAITGTELTVYKNCYSFEGIMR